MIDDLAEPPADEFDLARVLAALADPHRLVMVRYVAAHGESWCSRVIQDTGLEMSKSTFSHHLRMLRLAGVVTKRHEGTKGYVSLRAGDLDHRFPGLIGAVLSAEFEPAA
ncbi:MAG TPA: metalloregulator ArsR/SmtB family transcription factor [Trebonia sp.]|nr:metalloregulator ArsR/SmtB family transcription factor [Trebonia sp.]